MSDKILEYLALAATGAVIYLVAENNTPALKRAVSNIHSTISNIIPVPTSEITPVSTTPPRDDRPPAPRGTCPKGMYPDYTLGILHCHSSGGTRELNPNIKLSNQEWENAWGDNAWASPPLIPSSSNTLAPPKPIPQTLDEQKKYKPYPAVTGRTGPNKNLCTGKCRPGTCDSQGFCIDLGCGSVIHGGSQCKGKAVEHKKHTTTKKKPSIVIPPNFPDTVEITPGEEPYPEDQPTPIKCASL